MPIRYETTDGARGVVAAGQEEVIARDSSTGNVYRLIDGTVKKKPLDPMVSYLRVETPTTDLRGNPIIIHKYIPLLGDSAKAVNNSMSEGGHNILFKVLQVTKR